VLTEDIYSTCSTVKKELPHASSTSSVHLVDNQETDQLYQKLSMLQLRLDETTKTLQVERE
jgi:hypothetical protein